MPIYRFHRLELIRQLLDIILEATFRRFAFLSVGLAGIEAEDNRILLFRGGNSIMRPARIVGEWTFMSDEQPPP